ncbi:MAG: RNA polymerase sigma factor [Planctomycetota bacterium]|jgi:RNA polymerase sigma-70 factor (ECF subfamily)
MSNLPGSRIILSEGWYQKGIRKVAGELNQQSWAGIAGGDAGIWREFISKEIHRLYNMFVKRWPNPSLAEELVQRTVFDAVRGRATYEPSRGSPEEWISGIARNVVRLEMRKRASLPSLDGDISSYVEVIDTEPLPDQIVEQKETAVLVRTALDRLQTKEQTVLKAKYIEGLSANEIARQMDITVKAVHSLLYRARISLREELKSLVPPR